MTYEEIIDQIDLKGMLLNRMDDLIAVMLRAVDQKYTFDMAFWQEYLTIDRPIQSEVMLHSCGSAACFAGWVAISPEFQENGGRASTADGCPIFLGNIAGAAITTYLGLDPSIDNMTTKGLGHRLCYASQDFYQVRPVTAQHVLSRLEYAREVAVRQQANQNGE